MFEELLNERKEVVYWKEMFSKNWCLITICKLCKLIATNSASLDHEVDDWVKKLNWNAVIKTELISVSWSGLSIWKDTNNLHSDVDVVHERCPCPSLIICPNHVSGYNNQATCIGSIILATWTKEPAHHGNDPEDQDDADTIDTFFLVPVPSKELYPWHQKSDTKSEAKKNPKASSIRFN